MNGIASAKTLKRRNFKHLQLNPESLAPPPAQSAVDAPLPVTVVAGGHQLGLASAEADDRLRRYSQIPQRGPGVDVRALEQSDLEFISELGFGSGGTVSKVLHKPSGVFMAKKMIYLESNADVRRHIVNELETLKVCDSDFIVRYYGQFVEQNQVIVCMEYMDCGSLDKVYRAIGPLSEDVLAYVNAAVVDGLVYLKQLNITHRDIKPSNILVNKQGDIKLCDFGVSGVLINSIAQTFIGTSMYMSPERITGDEYTDAGDVWSLGLSLVEMARGEFPIKPSESGEPPAIFELLQSIVEDPSPRLPRGMSPEFNSYVDACLMKEKDERITVRKLNQTQFYQSARTTQKPNPLREWASRLLLTT